MYVSRWTCSRIRHMMVWKLPVAFTLRSSVLVASCVFMWHVGDDSGCQGCLDRLDKDIKAKQKAALWRGQRSGQTSPFSIQGGVNFQAYLSCVEIGGGGGPLAVTLTQICLTYSMCDCILYMLVLSYLFHLWRPSFKTPFTSTHKLELWMECKDSLIITLSFWILWGYTFWTAYL